MKSPRLREPGGFTLIEIMIVLAILGMLFSFVGVNVMKNWGDAKQSIARSQLGLFAEALDHYSLDNDGYPTTEQGLLALVAKPERGASVDRWHGPYLRKAQLPLDPWGSSFRYEAKASQGYRLCSDGPDRESGTRDDLCAE